MAKFIPQNRGPAVIRSANSNAISDAYRDSICIMYQFIDSTIPNMEFTLGGRTFETPIMAGPIKVPENQEGGMMAYAKAVQEAGSIFYCDFHHNQEWAEILKAGIPGIRVIKPLADNERLAEEIRFDEEHGAIGYAMDISHGMTVYGENDAQAEPFSAKTFEDLKYLNEVSSLPFFLKDIQSLHDAKMAKEIGVAGIILSGHNNRFPCAIPPLKLLPMIRKEVGDDMLIFLDGGMNTGYDAFKALALGADGVLCARTLAASFAKGGPEGLTQKILEISAELKGAMANTGSADLQHINRDCLVILNNIL